MFHEFQEKRVFVTNWNCWKIKEMSVRRSSIRGVDHKNFLGFQKVFKNVFCYFRTAPYEKNVNFRFFSKFSPFFKWSTPFRRNGPPLDT